MFHYYRGWRLLGFTVVNPGHLLRVVAGRFLDVAIEIRSSFFTSSRER